MSVWSNKVIPKMSYRIGRGVKSVVIKKITNKYYGYVGGAQ